MRTPLPRLTWAALALCPLFGLGCATSTTVAKPQSAKPSQAQVVKANPNAPVEINARARLLFEDANKAAEAQRRSRHPDWAKAERKYQEALAADPRLAEAEYDLGVLAERQGALDPAAAHFRAALKLKPSLWQAKLGLGELAQHQGGLAQAQAQFEAVLAADPDDAAARAHLAELALAQGKHEQAMEYARAALEHEPKSLTAYKVMMSSYLERKQYALAKLVALRATKIDDADPQLYFTVGQVLEHEGEPDKAKGQYKKASELGGGYLPADLALARIALKEEDYPAAERELRRALQLGAKTAQVHLDLGVAYKGMAQLDRAMAEYDEAEKLDPKLAAVYLDKAIILHRYKDAPDKAVELYKKYLAMEGRVSAEAPVMGLLKEAQQLVQAKVEAQRAEEQAKQLEAAQKRQQEELKANEAKEKAAKAGGGAGANPGVKPAKGDTAAQPVPATGTQAGKAKAH